MRPIRRRRPSFSVMDMTTATIFTDTLPARDEHSTVPVVGKGWHPDPMAIHKFRWHDGTEWTGHVTHYGPVPCRHCTA